MDANSELEVRRTARAIVTRHIRATEDRGFTISSSQGKTTGVPSDKFWPELDIYPPGAFLYNLGLEECELKNLNLSGAEIAGVAELDDIKVENMLSFNDTVFFGDATISQLEPKAASFAGVAFKGRMKFTSARHC